MGELINFFGFVCLFFGSVWLGIQIGQHIEDRKYSKWLYSHFEAKRKNDKRMLLEAFKNALNNDQVKESIMKVCIDAKQKKQKEVEKKVDGYMMAFMSLVDEVQDVNKQNLMLRQRVRDLWTRCVKSETDKTIPELKESMCYSFDLVNDSEEVKSICVFDPTETRIICNKGVSYGQFLNNLQHQSLQCGYMQIVCVEHAIESEILFGNSPIKVADKLKYQRRGGFYFKKTNFNITSKTRIFVTLNPKNRVTIQFIPEYDWSEIY